MKSFFDVVVHNVVVGWGSTGAERSRVMVMLFCAKSGRRIL